MNQKFIFHISVLGGIIGGLVSGIWNYLANKSFFSSYIISFFIVFVLLYGLSQYIKKISERKVSENRFLYWKVIIPSFVLIVVSIVVVPLFVSDLISRSPGLASIGEIGMREEGVGFNAESRTKINTVIGDVVIMKVTTTPEYLDYHLKCKSIISVCDYMKRLSRDSAVSPSDLVYERNEFNRRNLPRDTIRVKYKTHILDLFYPTSLENKVSWFQADSLRNPEYYLIDDNITLIYDSTDNVGYFVKLNPEKEDAFYNQSGK